jgi:hypothetical protein
MSATADVANTTIDPQNAAEVISFRNIKWSSRCYYAKRIANKVNGLSKEAEGFGALSPTTSSIEGRGTRPPVEKPTPKKRIQNTNIKPMRSIPKSTTGSISSQSLVKTTGKRHVSIP